MCSIRTLPQKKSTQSRRGTEHSPLNCHSRDPPSLLRSFGGLLHSPAEAFCEGGKREPQRPQLLKRAHERRCVVSSSCRRWLPACAGMTGIFGLASPAAPRLRVNHFFRSRTAPELTTFTIASMVF